MNPIFLLIPILTSAAYYRMPKMTSKDIQKVHEKISLPGMPAIVIKRPLTFLYLFQISFDLSF